MASLQPGEQRAMKDEKVARRELRALMAKRIIYLRGGQLKQSKSVGRSHLQHWLLREREIVIGALKPDRGEAGILNLMNFDDAVAVYRRYAA